MGGSMRPVGRITCSTICLLSFFSNSLGVAETFSFPTQPFVRAYVSPRVTVLLILALAAALAQLGIIAAQ